MKNSWVRELQFLHSNGKGVNITARHAIMETEKPAREWRQLQALFEAGTATGLTDGQLLERYRAKRTESSEAAAAAELAFAALVDRHGAMVWGVCRRVLGNAHEAEDAFQATFLILVRKAGTVRVDGSLGRWLYGVATRVARRARSDAEHRRSAIGGVPPPSSDDPASEAELRDLCAVVSEELDGLPAKYRCAVELCHLQGMTYEQAARQLNWPVATVKNRLTKGRLRLRQRLARRGLASGALAVGMNAALTDQTRAAVPPQLVQSTSRAATAGASGGLPATVVELTEGVLQMMKWQKLKLMAASFLAALGIGVTAHALSERAPNGTIVTALPLQTAAQPAESPAEQKGRDPRWARSLPCGATIEVVGISSVPSGPNTWWRPDGTPLRPAPCDPREKKTNADNAIDKVVLVRLDQIPLGADHEWTIIDARGHNRRPARRGGKPVPGLSETVASVRADTSSCTVRFKVAAGPWNTIATGGKDVFGGGTAAVGSYIFGYPTASAQGTTLSVTHNINDQCVRIVAVGNDGKVTAGLIRSTIDVTAFRQIQLEFDPPPDEIKEFRLETRPYEQVEIPLIALKRE
jgi:RNA polymerase sigma factor (sigma-70 family)